MCIVFMPKRHINVTVEDNLIDKIKKEGINISNLVEDAIIEKVNERQSEKSVIPEFTPEEYESIRQGESSEFFISNRGVLARRGKPLFFINEFGKVREVSEAEYTRRLNIMGRLRTNVKWKKPKKGQTYPHMD